MAAGRIRSIEKKFSYVIANPIRDLPACSIVPQLTMHPRVHEIIFLKTLQPQQSHIIFQKRILYTNRDKSSACPVSLHLQAPSFLTTQSLQTSMSGRPRRTCFAARWIPKWTLNKTWFQQDGARTLQPVCLQELDRCSISATLDWMTRWGCGVACPIVLNFHLPGHLKATVYSENIRDTVHVSQRHVIIFNPIPFTASLRAGNSTENAYASNDGHVQCTTYHICTINAAPHNLRLTGNSVLHKTKAPCLTN
jgi:hypothetical protein